MILEFIPSSLGTQHGNFYTGVPKSSANMMPASRRQNHIVVASLMSEVRRYVSDQTKAIIWEGNLLEGTDLVGDVPLIQGRLFRLPKDRKYLDDIRIESFSGFFWNECNIVDIDGTQYLAGKSLKKRKAYRIPVDPGFKIDSLSSSIDARRQVLGSLGMPGALRISPNGYIAINPTK